MYEGQIAAKDEALAAKDETIAERAAQRQAKDEFLVMQRRARGGDVAARARGGGARGHERHKGAHGGTG